MMAGANAARFHNSRCGCDAIAETGPRPSRSERLLP